MTALTRQVSPLTLILSPDAGERKLPSRFSYLGEGEGDGSYSVRVGATN